MIETIIQKYALNFDGEIFWFFISYLVVFFIFVSISDIVEI